MKASLPIPKELEEMVQSGFWPRDNKAALRQNLKSIVPAEIIREFAPDETTIYFSPPSSFGVVRARMEGSEKRFWLDANSALAELNPDLTMVIGDFGLGSDAPLALDYRKSMSEPSVIRLKWSGEGNHWVEVTPTFAAFAKLITKKRS